MINTHRFLCLNEEQTISLGKMLANIAVKGDVFLLDGTLGMGKTVLARAFIQEISQAKEVPSPTFSLLQCYPGRHAEIYHYDLYRLKKAEEIFELGIEEAVYEGISLIEWPEKMEIFRPKDAFNVKILPDKKNENGRIIEICVNSQEKSNRLSKVSLS